MALAGKAAGVSCCTTESGSYNAVAGINSISFGPKFEKLDTTSFDVTNATGDYTGAVCRMAGVTDIDCKLDGDYSITDTNGQTLMVARCAGGASVGTSLWFKVMPVNATAGSGWRFEALIEMSLKFDVKGKIEVTYDLICISKIQADNAA